MRNDDPGLDSSISEELPERESSAGEEREGEEDGSAGGVERETVDDADRDAGVESPPRDADRANLLP
ncbi:MAG: hypothetical protein KY464_00295 [Gemmatimonadetes bacterium]|nr:hypothetical protein [Gemmatimonadota bacterium]